VVIWRDKDCNGSDNAIAQPFLDEIKRLAARFDRVEGRLSNLDGRMSTLDSRMGTIESVVADLDGRIKSWPDMHDL
jgi:hypothetical protein